MQHYWRKCNINAALNEVLVTLIQYIKGGYVSVKVMVNTCGDDKKCRSRLACVNFETQNTGITDGEAEIPRRSEAREVGILPLRGSSRSRRADDAANF